MIICFDGRDQFTFHESGMMVRYNKPGGLKNVYYISSLIYRS